ncbi:YqhG family protein [Paenibacillus rigui]|uniref:Uncharacterized protein n=1 Tax=Paenibacillus rigui TaxID=554312 RepID=A0A229UMG2_9BACL|nr:YqhG family protein [Paenibacillus rigui]OXM84079.1 hypothetical protein CF651_21785 [Paenibacillus rigui]
MKPAQIQDFVMRYLEAEQCDILEKHPDYVTVKLSPSADKELTFRPYYWSFVERTGVPPETMTCTFIFNPESYKASQSSATPQAVERPDSSGMAAPTAPAGSGTAPLTGAAAVGGPNAGATGGVQHAPDSILGRYFGFVPTQVVARVPKDEVTFGSRRLEQIFDAVRSKGRFVHLFEEVRSEPRSKTFSTQAYESWMQVNFKVELACDMKRSEIHSLGIHLVTGQIVEQFQEVLKDRALTPVLPAHVYMVPDKFTLPRAVIYLEQYLEQKLRSYDHTWASEARIRLEDEIARIRSYYEPLLQAAEPEAKADIENQYRNREQEIDWQYRPRIQISVINCGLFHLLTGNPGMN